MGQEGLVKVKLPPRLRDELRKRRQLQNQSYTETVTRALERHFEEEARLKAWERGLANEALAVKA